MEWNLAPEFDSLIIVLIILAYAGRDSNLPSLENKFFKSYGIVTLVTIVFNIASKFMVSHQNIFPNVMIYIITTIYIICTPILGLVYFYYVVIISYPSKTERKRIIKLGLIPTAIYIVVALTNVIHQQLFMITKEEGYVRGSAIFLSYFLPYLYCVGSIVVIVCNIHRLEKKMASILGAFPSFIILMTATQQFFPNIILTGMISASTLLILYLYLQNKQIYLDHLTKLPNRWKMLNIMEMLLESNDSEKKVLLMVVSLQDFKQVNDMFGQQRGDKFLKQISKFLCEIIPDESIYRFSGDEFAVLFLEHNKEQVEECIQKIQMRMQFPWHVEEYQWVLSTAIGIVSRAEKTKTMESMMQAVEYAVLEAKKNNNQVCWFDEDMMQKIERKKQIIQILKQKLEDQSFEMYYQPIYAVSEQKFLYAESLIRMNDTPIGPIYPSEFIPIAEETGIIVEMTYVILDKVCKFVKRLIENGIEMNSVHVNFSPLQFSQIDLQERVLEIIKQNDIPNISIKIEFTESALAESTDIVTDFALTMQKNGIKMGLDDFGTGYSNISTVMNIPFNAVKLDRSLVWAAMKDEKSSLAIQGIIDSFKALGMQMVAEGVETEEQKQKVIEYGVDQIQGYYFSKPLPEDEALEFLKRENSKDKEEIL